MSRKGPTRIWDPRYELADVETIRGLQLRRLKEVFAHAWATNDFYRRRFKAAGIGLDDINRIEDFTARVPTISKSDFLADQNHHPPYGSRHDHVLSLRTSLFIYTTSGTSGQGQEIHMQTTEELGITNEQVYPYLFRWAGLDRGDGVFLAMPISMLGGGRLEYHGALAYGLTVYPVGNYDAARKVELLRHFRPKAVIANTSYLGRLGALLESSDEDRSVKTLITGGEGSGLAWLERLQKVWGAAVYDRYGCSQSGNDHMFCCDMGIGDRTRPGMLHNIDPLMFVEVVDPSTGRHVSDGEEGELVLTSLYRLDSPLIRCRVGDRAVYHEPGYCSCGRPFMGVQIASISRMDDMKKIKGINVWPQAVDDVMFQISEVAEYQVVLTSTHDGVDVVTVRAMTKEKLAARSAEVLEARVAGELHRRIGIHIDVDLRGPGEIQIDEHKARRWLDQRSISSDRPSAVIPKKAT